MGNSLVISDLLLLDFNKSRVVYSFDSEDFNKYTKASTKAAKTLRISGYAIEHKPRILGGEKVLYALFVQGENIYFLAGSQCFDVTSEDNFLIRKKIGFLKYKLTLKSKTGESFSVDYCEFAETQPEDMDSHFFVDALHWLKGSKTKSDLIEFWKGWGKE